eukprot:1162187-Pyramimonas_sp.AAC.1
MMWFIDGLKREMPEADADSLDEYLPTMTEVEVLQLNAMFGRVLLELEAGDVGWGRRRRLFWASWGLLPSFEAAAH